MTAMDLPVSRVARERYEFKDPILPPFDPTAGPAAPGAADTLVRRMGDRRAPGSSRPPSTRQLDAMAVIHEAMHRVVAAHGGDGEAVFRLALEGLASEVGSDALDEALLAYAGEFPPEPVYRDELRPPEYLAGSDAGRPRTERTLEELLLLWLTNRNPAFMRHGELFDDWPVARASLYTEIVDGLRRQISSADGSGGPDLISILLAPIEASPDSLAGQLRYIREHWPAAAELVDRLASDEMLSELDAIEDVAAPAVGVGGGGPPDAQALHGFAGLDADLEAYSPDQAWMPRLVLIAKSTYVWLDQLSRAYGHAIRTLDAIPDEELDRLAARGLSGLWLIGVWERSPASQRIKQLAGNPEAVASAYSLMDYRISEDLGGEAAFAQLRDRAWQRGIRLAADMVPNHMGIDSRWVVEHPERFISRSDSPFPAYSFSGPNLSNDERVGIYLEDHYHDSSDAAVVFKRVDRWSGEERFVYHGNDGTNTPWNDTAQLDYLREDTREAVIQTILAVARRAPIIRFDAAMTLARKHIQRLWYPLPGSGEAIPSRAESAVDAQTLERLLPREFWREVVDRVATEAPDTLLLAEAFWLMEGYFVRTLGMHRVYNSAFMHMLRDEKNAEYRLVLRNTMAFDTEILKRYVNFMSNPDERTAIDQFGDGDKYFGVATLMATLPGLPMFGHGQVEGLTERYGMEFRRARLGEEPRTELIERHEREIFPLLHQRSRFASARDFRLFDARGDDGGVLEDVFAYSHAEGDRRSLILYHNRFAEVRGTVRDSVPASIVADDGRRTVTSSLADALGLPHGDDAWLILHDERSGQEWLRNCREVHENGLDVELRAYECRVFLDPRVVQDRTLHEYRRLADRLGRGPVANVEEALHDLLVSPAREAIVALFDAAAFRRIAGAALGSDEPGVESAISAERERFDGLLRAIATAAGRAERADEATSTLDARLRALVGLVRTGRRRDASVGPATFARWLGPDRARWVALLGWAYGSAVATALDVSADDVDRDGGWSAEWGVDAALGDGARGLGADDAQAWRAVELARALLATPEDELSGLEADVMPRAWAERGPIRRATGWNEWQGTAYIDRDAFGGFLDALLARELLRSASRGDEGPALDALVATVEGAKEAGESAGWQVPGSGQKPAEESEPQPDEPTEAIATESFEAESDDAAEPTPEPDPSDVAGSSESPSSEEPESA